MGHPAPTLRQLRYLVTVCRTGHFGRAAEACRVTQSTLSAGIAELERLLGVTLFERTGRSVMPTPLAIEMAERARAVLRQVDDIVEMAQARGEPLAGPLRLGVIPTIGPFLLPRVERALRATYPALKLVLREDQSARLMGLLASGEMDAAILAFPYDTPGMTAKVFHEDRLFLATPPGHPLAARQAIPVEAIPRDELLLLEDGHCLRDHALGACRIEGRPTGEIQGTSLYTLVQMVAGGLGVTLVPAMAKDSAMLSGIEVAYRPIASDGAARDVGLVWRATSSRAEEFDDLAAVLETEMKNDTAA